MGKGLPRSMGKGPEIQQEIIKKSISLNGKTITTTNGDTAVGYGTLVLQGLPQGNIKLLGCVCNIATLTKGSANIVDAFDGDFGVGTTPADDATITGTDVNIIPSTALQQGVSGVSSANRGVSTATQEVIIDNTAGTGEINLNLLIDDADISDDDTLTLTGDFHIAYIVLGDD